MTFSFSLVSDEGSSATGDSVSTTALALEVVFGVGAGLPQPTIEIKVKSTVHKLAETLIVCRRFENLLPIAFSQLSNIRFP